jgi:NADPH:quinone reductase-like Zn-dependent oxidoreductase
MNTIVVCNKYLQKRKTDIPVFDFSVYNKQILIGIVDIPSLDCKKDFTDDSVLVLVKAFSCNYRDKAMILTFYDLCSNNIEKHKYRYSPFGSEFVAEVLDVGNNVKSFKKGDRVIPDCNYFAYENKFVAYGIPSSFASQRVQLFKENQLMKIPDTMPDKIAASFSISSQTGYSMIRKLNLSANATVLVTAATSNTSLSVIQILNKMGINIYVISSNSNYKDNLLKMGIKSYIPFYALECHLLDDYIKSIRFDAIIDSFFDIYYNYLVPYLVFGGKYIYCGMYRQSEVFDDVIINARYNHTMIENIAKNITVISNCLGETKDLEQAIVDFKEGLYNIVIDSVYTGRDVIPFMQKTFLQIPRFGKVVYKYE